MRSETPLEAHLPTSGWLLEACSSGRRESSSHSQLGKRGRPHDGELERMLMAGHRVMLTPSNGRERRRPRDIPGRDRSRDASVSVSVGGVLVGVESGPLSVRLPSPSGGVESAWWCPGRFRCVPACPKDQQKPVLRLLSANWKIGQDASGRQLLGESWVNHSRHRASSAMVDSSRHSIGRPGAEGARTAVTDAATRLSRGGRVVVLVG